MRLITLAAIPLALAGCAGSSNMPPAQLAWGSAKIAVGTYLVASHASPGTMLAISKAEAAIDVEVAQLAQMAPPKTPTQVVADVQAMIAALPAGVVPAKDAALVQLGEDVARLASALVPGGAPAVALPAPAVPAAPTVGSTSIPAGQPFYVFVEENPMGWATP